MDYPAHLARRRTLADGRTVVIRPIRPEDKAAVQFDYDRRMAFVCEAEAKGPPTIVGEARYVADPGGRSCEFGVVIADDWHGSGIAGLLMDALIRAAQARGLETMEGLVLRDNAEMLKFVRALGFETSPDPEDPATLRAVRKL
ncbi:MAG TPA: GNAT family N-acetyltransferase [Burkholderiales bacterium]|nr:GNAT family N-acetyltransferase [Burkholderiales bacterium]